MNNIIPQNLRTCLPVRLGILENSTQKNRVASSKNLQLRPLSFMIVTLCPENKGRGKYKGKKFSL